MEIKFYTHACFSISDNRTVLLNDPYLFGTAFNDGWDLIYEINNFKFDDNKDYFIYFSHEHPDHFSIQFLKSLSKEIRSKITVIYQKTKDGRVKEFITKFGFKFIDLNDKKRYEFAKSFFITIGQVPFYDSWALIEIEGKKILNANDCILETPERVKDIKKVTKNVDILFTQYSYANWVEGGKDNKLERVKLANEKLSRIKMQFDVLSPTFIVPFASMVRFCHEENSYMNDAINTPGTTVEFIEKNTSSKPYLMTPYEVWDGIKMKDNKDAKKFWNDAYTKALKKDLIKVNKAYSLEDIEIACNNMLRRVKEKNNYLLIFIMSFFKIIPKQNIYITDLNKIINFSWSDGLKIITFDNSDNFVEMSSEPVHFIFSFDFGIDTLNVNARFKGNLLQKKKLIRTFSLLELNNTGRYISFRGLLDILLEPTFVKQGLRTVGLIR